jgi:hypothetical protein
MQLKKKELMEIIDSNGDLIGKNDMPAVDANADTQANNTTDYNAKIGTQPFRYDMLGRFGFTMMPFLEGKEDQGQLDLLDELSALMHNKFVELTDYYIKHPNLLKPDNRKAKEESVGHNEECEKRDIEWAKEAIKIFQSNFEKAFKEPIDEALNKSDNLSLPMDDEIKYELKRLLTGSKYDKGGILDQRVDQLLQVQAKWLERAKELYSAEEIAKKLFIYDKNLNSGVSLDEAKVAEDKIVDKKAEDEISNKTEDKEVREKKLEKIAGLINKLEKNDKEKIKNLLERK